MADERIIATLLREASEKDDIDTIRILLNLCDDIYYTTKPHNYNGKTYTIDDLPSDRIYSEYRKKYTPDVNVASLYVRSDDGNGAEIILHDFPMGSLTKYDSTNIQKLATLFDRLGSADGSIAITLKIDGVSVQAHFAAGSLMKAVTRYDHKTGRSVIEIASRYVRRPDPSFRGKIVIAGETILRPSVSAKLGFSNPRNGAAGILNRKTLNQASYLDYIAFDLVHYAPTPDDVKSGWPAAKPPTVPQQFDLMKRLGYEVTPLKIVGKTALTEPSLNATMDELHAQIDAPYDGLVICPITWVLETEDPPKMKVAYKGPSIGDWTVVERIEPHTTRTGNVIPQVYVEPVHITGSIITSIAGANYSVLMDRRICIGSKVFVIKSKEIIPYIDRVDNDQVDIIVPPVPTKCPSCDETLRNDALMLTCPNVACPARMMGQVKHFIDTIGINGIGVKRLEKLNAGTIQDLYALSQDAIANIPGMGTKTATTIYNALRECLINVDQGKLLAAINPGTIGPKLADQIVKSIPLDTLFGNEEITLSRLMDIKGIGKDRAHKILSFHREGANIIKFLRTQGMTMAPVPTGPSSASASGAAPEAQLSTSSETTSHDANQTKIMVICLSGKGPRTRAAYEQIIVSHGWTFVNSISSKTTLLVTSDGASTKTEKAATLGIRVINYDDFEAMIISG